MNREQRRKKETRSDDFERNEQHSHDSSRLHTSVPLYKLEQEYFPLCPAREILSGADIARPIVDFPRSLIAPLHNLLQETIVIKNQPVMTRNAGHHDLNLMVRVGVGRYGNSPDALVWIDVFGRSVDYRIPKRNELHIFLVDDAGLRIGGQSLSDENLMFNLAGGPGRYRLTCESSFTA